MKGFESGITGRITAKITSRLTQNGFGLDANTPPQVTYVIDQNGNFMITEESDPLNPDYIITTNS